MHKGNFSADKIYFLNHLISLMFGSWFLLNLILGLAQLPYKRVADGMDEDRH
jgi:hypothetical protein